VLLAAKLYAEEIKNAGADQVVIVMLHNLDIIPYFGLPVTHLAAKYLIIEESKELIGADDAVILAPDDGRKNRSLTFGEEMRLPVICGRKERSGDGEVKFFGIDGEVKKRVLIIDDELNKGDTLEKISVYLIENYQTLEELMAAFAHGVLCGDAIKKLSRILDLARSRGVRFRTLFTNSLPIPATKRLPNMKIISIAPMLADVVRAIHLGEEIDPKYLY
jgi:ribose-phosphate pyrophosphokinase